MSNGLYEFDKKLAQLCGYPMPHEGSYRSAARAGAQIEQRKRWGEIDENGNRK